MKITVHGAGYVGLVTAACLSEMGNDVLLLDTDSDKINTLISGEIPIHEPGLQEMANRNTAAGRLVFTDNVKNAVDHGVLQFIAVGTPPAKDGAAEMQHVWSAAQAIGRQMTEYKLIVNKSTVPVGTSLKVTEVISSELHKRRADFSFAVVSNPEFLKEGTAIQDFMRPDRVLIGSKDEQAINIMRQLYAPYLRNHDRLITMDACSAELAKYAANAMLATRISFMNELANIAEQIGADIEAVRLGVGSDSRIGYSFLYAGCGYGGSCLPKDMATLIKTAHDCGIKPAILEAVQETNSRQKKRLTEKIFHRFGPELLGKRFALWGLAFKPNTDDMREASSQQIIADLIRSGATVQAYDPVAMSKAKNIYKTEQRVSFSESALGACKGADALIIVTEWQQFRSPDFEVLRKTLLSPIIFDGRNLYDPHLMQNTGFEYHPIGRLNT